MFSSTQTVLMSFNSSCSPKNSLEPRPSAYEFICRKASVFPPFHHPTYPPKLCINPLSTFGTWKLRGGSSEAAWEAALPHHIRALDRSNTDAPLLIAILPKRASEQESKTDKYVPRFTCIPIFLKPQRCKSSMNDSIHLDFHVLLGTGLLCLIGSWASRLAALRTSSTLSLWFVCLS